MWRRHAITFWSLSTYFFVGNKTATICSMVYCISFDRLLITHKESSSDDYQSIITEDCTLCFRPFYTCVFLQCFFNDNIMNYNGSTYETMTVIYYSKLYSLLRVWHDHEEESRVINSE